jgi:ABC-2 type transport system ATP-binding protein
MKSRVGGEVVELRNAHDDVIREIPTGGSIADVKDILDGLVHTAEEGMRISIRRPSLDDVFLAFTETEKGASL